MVNYNLSLFFIFFVLVSGFAQDTIPLTNGIVVGSTGRSNRSIIYKDAVLYDLITQDNYEPNLNDVIGLNRDGEDEKWESISADEKGVFKSRKLRGGYLYITYESPKSEVKILEISGHGEVYVNGIPRGGDVYNKHLTYHPIQLKKGKNTFLVKGGRGQVNLQLLPVLKSIDLLERDMTIPDFLTTENDTKIGSIRILNSTLKTLKGLKIVTETNGHIIATKVPSIIPLSMRKVPYSVQDNYSEKDTVRVKVQLFKGNTLLDESSVLYKVKTPEQFYSRTFISDIDGSVQYFSVKEGNLTTDDKPAMFLSLHGASVEARRQAAEYKAKDWGHVIAPTNRRNFGFDWEDWGRWDAMEVQAIAEKMYGTDPKKTYLTGHSMGGHGTWQIGVTFPSKWAAIAPISGWYSLFSYANKEKIEDAKPLEQMFERSSHASYTLELSKNYLQHGIYIQHGDADDVVPVEQARFMRNYLGDYHPDFAYLEYPDKKHWFGIDFSTIFDYFKWHTIPNNGDVKSFEFRTATPGVSSESRYITLYQQDKQFEFSGVKVSQNVRNEKQIKKGEVLKTRSIQIETENLKKFKLDLRHAVASDTIQVKIDSTSFANLSEYKQGDVWFEKQSDTWVLAEKPINTLEKNPLRYGSFKDAFKHNMVFVYATKGTQEENDWSFNKARFDAETFYYKGNGAIEIVSDKDFKLSKYKDRSVILYGNASTNKAWKLLLSNSPVQIKRNQITVGNKTFTGNEYGVYFTYPRTDSEIAAVGVVSGTGITGFKSVTPNRYFSSGVGIPDVMVFTPSTYKEGVSGIKAAGFFGNDWSLENGDIEFETE
ncbi:prolyl oligopeptidase family serine peptidase [uncultured Formosa sp.]|uniref:prolyl oligopeptidase family serine peptidase n=1 Tax=uncultured Formosa sp. TaxID=255435 RepID=UPI00261E3408|nr:prolyl oligopeptidase family serine peptidase [uncultured Formosa sp.]